MQNTPKEWSLLQRIRERVQRQDENTVVGLGDDAFVFKNYPGYSVLCQDMLVEGTHFLRNNTTAFDLGHKSLAVNLSDICAMGANAHYVQVSLGLPENITESWLDEFYEGLCALADRAGCKVIGGDLTKSDLIIVDISVHGSCEHPLTRQGAMPGDILLCSGPLGLAHTGLLALQKNLKADFLTSLEKHRRPSARLDLVPTLQIHYKKVRALMDCSDGLINDALQMAGSMGLELFTDPLQIHHEIERMALIEGRPAEDFLLWGGEDYELLLAVAPEDRGLFPGFQSLGHFTSSPGVFVHIDGKKEEIKTFKGWQHF